MINIKDHIVEIEGTKYVPLDIVEKIADDFDTKLDEALSKFENSVLEINKVIQDND